MGFLFYEKGSGRLPVTQGLTSLAVGADQLFAKQLFERKIPYLAVIPCERYERTFSLNKR